MRTPGSFAKWATRNSATASCCGSSAIVLLIAVVLHITAAYQLTMINRQARPVDYATRKNVETTLGALTMRWSGVLLLVFVVFHLLHFTLGVVGFQPGQFVHLAVYQNVVAGFSVWPIAVFYILAMAALCLHLDHGIWSAFQTLGWSNARNHRSRSGSFARSSPFWCSLASAPCRSPFSQGGCAEDDSRIQHSFRSHRAEVGESPLRHEAGQSRQSAQVHRHHRG